VLNDVRIEQAELFPNVSVHPLGRLRLIRVELQENDQLADVAAKINNQWACFGML
jgi:hypothetical protein